MHQCLTIVEVQHAIFREVEAGYHGRKAYLARLARTCRTFNKAAVDILWETLPSIKYLIQCLPTDLWTTSDVFYSSYEKEIKFQRTMTARDWEIFFKYSPRIRSLSSSLTNAYRNPLSLDLDVIIVLSRPPSDGPLVPNLKALHWTELDDKYAPLLQSLLVCSLEDLSIPSYSLRFPEMTMDLIARCPLLENFNVHCDKFTVDAEGQGFSVETAIVHLLQCPLKSFECPSALNEAAILSLSKFPSLVKLSGRLQKNLQLGPHPTPYTFRSLRSLELKLSDNELPTLTSLLEVMHLGPQEVSFILPEDSSPTPDELRLFFFALVNACDPEWLSNISLTVQVDDGRQSRNRPQINLFTFEPLFALSNMKIFTLDVTCDISLDDNAIDVLTRHWPGLLKLNINASCGWGIQSRVTHQGLITLLTRCLSLSTFALAVDFSEVDIPPSSIPPSWRLGDRIASHCKHANFVSSTLIYPASIAAFLSDICPTLQEVTSFWTSENEVEDRWGRSLYPYGEMERNERKWERVDEFLPGFVAVRRQYRMMWERTDSNGITTRYFFA